MTHLWLSFFVMLVGGPIVWLRVRRTAAWKERPDEYGPVKLLELYLGDVTGLVVIWVVMVVVATLAGGELG